MKTSHEIVFKNAVDLMQKISPNSIDLVVTSPPYPMITMWDDTFIKQNPEIIDALKKNNDDKAFEMMHSLLDPVWKQLFMVLKKGGIACINIGDAVRTINDHFRLYQNHARIVKSMLDTGFSSLPCIIWRKQTNAPNKFMGSGMLPAGAYVTLEHEYILIFRKGEKREFLTEKEKAKRHESAYFWEERNNWFSDVWMDLKGASKTQFNKKTRDRSAAFTFELPYRLINMFSVKEDLVIDPFLGTGTTMIAAAASGRNSIGIEMDSGLKKDIYLNMQKVVGFSNERIKQRLVEHMNFVKKREMEKKEFKHQNIHYKFPVITNQEKDLFFNVPLRSKKTGENVFEVNYSEEPSYALNIYYGDIFTSRPLRFEI